METIKVQVLLYHSREGGNFITVTTYNRTDLKLRGQGRTEDEARVATEDVIVDYLERYLQRQENVPLPPRNLATVDEVTSYFCEQILPGATVVEDRTVVLPPERRPDGVMPPFVFEFYRVQD